MNYRSVRNCFSITAVLVNDIHRNLEFTDCIFFLFEFFSLPATKRVFVGTRLATLRCEYKPGIPKAARSPSLAMITAFLLLFLGPSRQRKEMGRGIVKRALNKESGSQNFTVMRAKRYVSKDALEAHRWYHSHYFSFREGDGSDTYTQFGGTGRSQPGEEGEGHHPPRQQQAQMLSWCLERTENSSCKLGAEGEGGGVWRRVWVWTLTSLLCPSREHGWHPAVLS